MELFAKKLNFVDCVFIIVLTFSISTTFADEDGKPEVKIEVLTKAEKCDHKSQDGDILTTEYIGTFPDGSKFDSTYDRKTPMTYTMGAGEVIRGCEIGTLNMCKGEKRRIIIPPHLGYGTEQYGQIPPNSTLHFDIVLSELEAGPFAQMGWKTK